MDFSTRTLALFARKNNQDLDAITGGFILDLLGIITLGFVSIKEGARKNGETLPKGFDEDMFGDWIDEDPGLAGRVLEQYYISQGLKQTDKEKEDVGKLTA